VNVVLVLDGTSAAHEADAGLEEALDQHATPNPEDEESIEGEEQKLRASQEGRRTSTFLHRVLARRPKTRNRARATFSVVVGVFVFLLRFIDR
jgi:hypothetical protein